MKKKTFMDKTKKVCKDKFNKFKFWFTKKDHYGNKYNKNLLFYNILKIIGLVIIFLIVNSNINDLNHITLIFIKLGSTLKLILTLLIIRKIWHLLINIKYFFHGLNQGTKAIISITIVILLFIAYQEQETIVNYFLQAYNETDFKTFNPVISNFNISSINLKEISKKLNTCPQIDVPIKETSWGDLNIKSQTYEGWEIKGRATCRKGTKEGENLNKYYCGGYSSTLGFGSVNAYIEKTIISEDGNIGKTYKYVIWNTYDENKQFLETRCIGDPDEFDKKQAESFYNEMLKWR